VDDITKHVWVVGSPPFFVNAAASYPCSSAFLYVKNLQFSLISVLCCWYVLVNPAASRRHFNSAVCILVSWFFPTIHVSLSYMTVGTAISLQKQSLFMGWLQMMWAILTNKRMWLLTSFLIALYLCSYNRKINRYLKIKYENFDENASFWDPNTRIYYFHILYLELGMRKLIKCHLALFIACVASLRSRINVQNIVSKLITDNATFRLWSYGL
jgi:hypothetical protein